MSSFAKHLNRVGQLFERHHSRHDIRSWYFSFYKTLAFQDFYFLRSWLRRVAHYFVLWSFQPIWTRLDWLASQAFGLILCLSDLFGHSGVGHLVLVWLLLALPTWSSRSSRRTVFELLPPISSISSGSLLWTGCWAGLCYLQLLAGSCCKTYPEFVLQIASRRRSGCQGRWTEDRTQPIHSDGQHLQMARNQRHRAQRQLDVQMAQVLAWTCSPS